MTPPARTGPGGFAFVRPPISFRLEPFNDRRQLAEMFPSIANAPNVTLEHLRHINHLIVLQKHQEEVISRIERWMDSVDWQAPPVAGSGS